MFSSARSPASTAANPMQRMKWNVLPEILWATQPLSASCSQQWTLKWKRTPRALRRVRSPFRRLRQNRLGEKLGGFGRSAASWFLPLRALSLCFFSCESAIGKLTSDCRLGHGLSNSLLSLDSDFVRYVRCTLAARRRFAEAADDRPSLCLLYTSDAADDLLCVDLGG